MVGNMSGDSQRSRKGQNNARRLNLLIDMALREPTDEHRHHFLQLASHHDISTVADRIRRRATLLIRRERIAGVPIVTARDSLILTLYANAAPKGWFCGWFDGSTICSDQRCISGIGGILTNPQGKEITQFGKYAGALPPFETEIVAAQTILESALQHGVERIRVYTDCRALLELWLKKREDTRLAILRSLAMRFKRIELRLIPRRHNHPANQLARNATADQG